MEGRLTNRRNVKKYIKEQFATKRPHLGVDRVGHRVFAQAEAKLRAWIDDAIMRQPSNGRKTFSDLF